MPTVISTAVISVVFYNIFNSYNGMVNTVLMKLHLVSQPVDWLGPKHAMLTVILVAVWGAVGNYMLLFLAGLQSIPQDLYERVHRRSERRKTLLEYYASDAGSGSPDGHYAGDYRFAEGL